MPDVSHLLQFDQKACFETMRLEDAAAFPHTGLAQQICGVGSAHFTEIKQN